MTETQHPTPPPGQPAPAKTLPRWALFALGGAAVLIVALVAVLATLLITSGEDPAKAGPSSSEAAEAETFTASGSITLIDSGIDSAAGSCWGSDGYDDMTAGQQVVVRDAEGTILASGQLETGEKEDIVTCVFDFTVEDIPSGRGIYSIEVSHRGSITFEEEDASSLSYTLG